MTFTSLHAVPRLALAALVSLCVASAHAAPVTYTLDPTHTFPSFEADHMAGMSVWRGKFNGNSGKVVLDKAAQTGELEVTIDVASIDYGLDAMNDKARSPEFFDVAKYPTALYKGKLERWVKGAPTQVTGALTLHGVTKPVRLQIHSFKCMPHPMLKRDWCGADAQATINREDFGVSAGKDWGFSMAVTLRIQVEAVASE